MTGRDLRRCDGKQKPWPADASGRRTRGSKECGQGAEAGNRTARALPPWQQCKAFLPFETRLERARERLYKVGLRGRPLR